MGRGFQEKKHLHTHYIWFQGAAKELQGNVLVDNTGLTRENESDGDTDLGIIYVKKVPVTMKFHGLTTKIYLKSLKNRDSS